ncbi:MAG: Gfo/Idh/MocA family protein [Ruegeria sp.]
MKKLLVVGGGLIGIRHVRAVQAHPGCQLVGLADPDMAINVDVPRFNSMEDVDCRVDGVIIATPTHLHAEHGKAAAQRGWHMLIEKPVAASVPDAIALGRAIKSAGVASLVGHHRRYHTSVQRLKSCITNGEIGRIVTVSLLWAMRKPGEYFSQNWRTSGGSPVMINLVHDIDLLRFVFGEISDIVTIRGASERDGDRVESGAVSLAFESGATGTISFSDASASPWGFEAGTGENPNIGTTSQDMMWITGTKGAISYPSMAIWHGRDWGTPAQKSRTDDCANRIFPLEEQLNHFLNVMDGARPLIDVEDGARTLAVTTRIQDQLAAQPVRRFQDMRLETRD